MGYHLYESYLNQGYLVVEGFIPEPLLVRLRDRAYTLGSEITQNKLPTFHPQEPGEYDLESTTREYCCFWEQPKTGASRLFKVSHALHKLDPLFQEFSSSSKIKLLLESLSLKQPQIVQSQLHFKPPFSLSSVGWHQDGSYIATTPCTTTGLWLALEDATLENGCLKVIPGAHQEGLTHQMTRTPSGKFNYHVHQNKNWDEYKSTPLPVRAGSLIVLHGLCPHKSDDNMSPASRLALSLHFFDLTSQYAKENWLPIELV